MAYPMARGYWRIGHPRYVEQKNRRSDVKEDTHIGRLKSESLHSTTHQGCDMLLRWYVEPTKTKQRGEKHYEKSFLVDNEYDSLSAGAAIEDMLDLRGRRYIGSLTAEQEKKVHCLHCR